MKPFSLDESTNVSENPDQGKIILFHQNFAEIDHIPQNFFLGAVPARFPGRIYGLFWGEQKSEINHDTQKCIVLTSRRIHPFPWLRNIRPFSLFNFVKFDTIKQAFKNFFLRDNPKKESLFIGGLVPMITCEYTIEFEKPEEKGFVIIQTPGGKIIIERKNSGQYSVDSYSEDTTEKLEIQRMIIPTTDGKISLTILFDGIARTNTISGNDQPPVTTRFFSTSRSHLMYPSFSGGYFKISNIILPNHDASTLRLYSLSQSASRKLITPIGDRKSLPFGLDGPHGFDTIKNGLLYMKKFGYRGTFWFDTGYLKDGDYTAFLKSLLQNESWEAGIHYSKSLTKLSPAESHTIISEEYETISSQLLTPPKSWCSLRNGDTVFHANYLYETFNMIWRNGDAGVRSERKVGGLEDANWEWWNAASNAGIIYPVFTHQTDKDPAQRYSISFSKFKTWIDNYHANGISIIPFHEWWCMNANTHDMVITDISVKNHTLRFRVKTNGEKGLVNVNVSAERDLVIRDYQTQERVNWSVYGDNSITFYVQSNHEYEIFHQNLRNIS
jgi:hypothetical protein